MSEDTQQRRWYRRTVLSATGASLTGLAGCSSTGDQGSRPQTSSDSQGGSPQTSRTEDSPTETESSETNTATEESDEPSVTSQNEIAILPSHIDGNSNKYAADYSGPGANATELWTASLGSASVAQSLVVFNGQATISGQGQGAGISSFDSTGNKLWERGSTYKLYPADEETILGRDTTKIIGLSTGDGSQQFQYSHSGLNLKSSRMRVPVINDLTVYYRVSPSGSSRETIAAVDAQEGSVVNRKTVSEETTDIQTGLTGTVVGDRLITYGKSSAVLDINGLSKQATISLGVSSIEVNQTNVAAIGDMLYLHAIEDGLFAYDLNEGELRWSNTDIYNGTPVEATIADGTSVYLVRPQAILAYSASDGTKLWEAPLTTEIPTLTFNGIPVAIGNESMYVCLDNGNVSILNIEDGQQTGQIANTGGRVPTVVGNRLYMLGKNLSVYGPA